MKLKSVEYYEQKLREHTNVHIRQLFKKLLKEAKELKTN